MNLEELSCKLECQDIMHRFCDALDRGANSEAADLFAEDAVMVQPHVTVVGPDVRTALSKRSSEIVTRHTAGNVVVTPTGPDTARGSAYVSVYRVPSSAPVPRPLPATPNALGDWKLEFRRTRDGWRISHWEATAAFEPAA